MSRSGRKRRKRIMEAISEDKSGETMEAWKEVCKWAKEENKKKMKEIDERFDKLEKEMEKDYDELGKERREK